MKIYRIQESFVFTIFGASGDLAQLKIFPALFALAEQKRFPQKFWIVGYARTIKKTEDFRNFFEDSVRKSKKKKLNEHQEKVLKELLNHVFYFSGQYDQEEDFQRYKEFCYSLTQKRKYMHVAYFSVPPTIFEPIVQNLARIRDSQSDDIRLVLEKPFGRDEHSARHLFHFIGQYFEEDQIYLLDHYLGKKAVRSLIPLRHMNRILNLMLKGREVANIQISALESVGVEHRLDYFDQVGTLKDMIQSHMLQMLALTTMSIPIKKDTSSIQKEKSAVLSALEFSPEKSSICLGQYEGYKKQSAKVKDSETPTFVALRLQINRESWYGVPIFLRAGKKLSSKNTYITLELKKFEFQSSDHEPNRVVIELYPDEKIHIKLLDEDGATARLGEIGASESIACQGDYCLPEHGLLLLDVIRNEKMHFLSFSEILASWQLIDAVDHFLEEQKRKPVQYLAGSSGPESQTLLMEGTPFRWYDIHEQNGNK